jgi:carbon-monoxide dehydrogenase small subunit
MKEKRIELHVNGHWKELQVASDQTLARLLREDLGLTGTKINCEQGECGVCTVLLDGKAVNSCLVLAASLDGHEVLTIEGLSEMDRLDPIQEAFIEKDASQCGFCTPGMIMSAKALLDEIPDPGLKDIQDGLAGNYCRCTGYKSIIEAVQTAAAKSKEGS